MRTTIRDNGHRVQMNVSRGTLTKVDDTKLWQTVDVRVHASEEHTEIERAQAYGFTTVPVKQDDDQQQGQQGQQGQSGGSGGGGSGGGDDQWGGQQSQGDAAEPIITYLNGSRSHPVVTSLDDRRHRLKELEEGDVAFYRLKDDQQQMLFHKDGTYLSTRDDKVLRIALVPKKQQQQSGQSPGQHADGSGSSGSQGSQQKKQYGQKSMRDDNKKSNISIQQSKNDTTVQHGNHYSSQRNSDSSIYSGDRGTSAQANPSHVHIKKGGASIFVDGGCKCSMPIILAGDGYCSS